MKRAIAQGIYPWWASPELRLSFFRPLASAWRAADFALWGQHPTMAHLEACVVYAALVYVVARVYRGMIGGAAAGLAAILFAVDDAHSLTVTWTANRYALLAALFGFTALSAHVRSREKGTSRLVAPILFAGALASGESAIGIAGYLTAYAFFADPGGRRAAFRSLVPFAAPVAVWAALYVALGHGTRGTLFYTDPVGQPGAFFRALPVRLPLLALADVFAPPAEIWAFFPARALPFAAAGAAVVAGLLVFAILRAARGDRRVFALACGSLPRGASGVRRPSR